MKFETTATLLFAVALIPACFEDDWHHDRDHREWECRQTNPAPDAMECEVPSCPIGADVLYLSADSIGCAAIDFVCPDGHDRFDAPCGCGCAPQEAAAVDPETCVEADDPTALYLSRESKVCADVAFTCPDGQVRFDSACGCGCWDACPSPEDPRVHYLSGDLDLCAQIDFSCPDTCTPFDDRCGCGCIEPAAPPACPEPSDPKVHYLSTDPDVCDGLSLSPSPDCTLFDDGCGCGCVED